MRIETIVCILQLNQEWYNNDDEGHFTESDDDISDAGFSGLEQLEAFVLESAAFDNFRIDLRNFVDREAPLASLMHCSENRNGMICQSKDRLKDTLLATVSSSKALA